MDAEEESLKSEQDSHPPGEGKLSVTESSTRSDSDYSVDGESEDSQDEEYYSDLRRNTNYPQVMLDVNRCASRVLQLRRTYLKKDNSHIGGNHHDEIGSDIKDSILQHVSTELNNTTAHDGSQSNNCRLTSYPSNGECINQDTPANLRSERRLKRKLADLIVKLLSKFPNLYYYQGFHDVCLTYMASLGHREAYLKLSRLVESHFAMYMQPTMSETQDLLSMIPIIVGLQNQHVENFMIQAEVGNIFALSWVITWFSHVIKDPLDINKIYSFLELQDPRMVVYLSAEIVLWKRNELLALDLDMSTVHQFLCQIPARNKLPVDLLIENATRAFDLYPPELVEKKLTERQRSKSLLKRVNIVSRFAANFGPIVIPSVRMRAPKLAMILLVFASAYVLQYRWPRFGFETK